jgi:hypothetical protein
MHNKLLYLRQGCHCIGIGGIVALVILTSVVIVIVIVVIVRGIVDLAVIWVTVHPISTRLLVCIRINHAFFVLPVSELVSARSHGKRCRLNLCAHLFVQPKVSSQTQNDVSPLPLKIRSREEMGSAGRAIEQRQSQAQRRHERRPSGPVRQNNRSDGICRLLV